jgi:hypothetical protein
MEAGAVSLVDHAQLATGEFGVCAELNDVGILKRLA